MNTSIYAHSKPIQVWHKDGLRHKLTPEYLERYVKPGYWAEVRDNGQYYSCVCDIATVNYDPPCKSLTTAKKRALKLLAAMGGMR